MIGVFILLICCLSLVMLVVGLIVEQAYNAIVLEDRGLLESFGAAGRSSVRMCFQ